MRLAGLQGIKRGQILCITVAGDKSLCPLEIILIEAISGDETPRIITRLFAATANFFPAV